MWRTLLKECSLLRFVAKISTSHSDYNFMIKGILTPLMVPLDDRNRIDESEFRRYIDWLIAKGVHGLYPNGSTGEFLRFTPQERQRIVTIVCEQAAGRVTVVAGAAEANVSETIRACEHCKEAGADAVAVVSPIYYRLSQESIYAYFCEIARHSPIDVTIYNIPALASAIEVETIRRLSAEFPRFIGIKDSSGDISFMIRLMAAVRPNRPDFSFLTGWEGGLLPMLTIGCDGATLATSGVIPEVTRTIFDAVKSGEQNTATAAFTAMRVLFETMIGGADFPEGFRAGVELRGFHMGHSRQPLSALQKQTRATLVENLRKLLAAPLDF